MDNDGLQSFMLILLSLQLRISLHILVLVDDINSTVFFALLTKVKPTTKMVE